MFNSITYKSETKVCPVTQVVEKTISPDKVSDMYKDVRKEVEDTILRTFVFNDNKVNGVVVQLEPDYAQRISHVMVRFTVNGKEEIEKFTKSREALTEEDAYKLLVDTFSEKVFAMVARAAGNKLV